MIAAVVAGYLFAAAFAAGLATSWAYRNWPDDQHSARRVERFWARVAAGAFWPLVVPLLLGQLVLKRAQGNRRLTSRIEELERELEL